jgi:hypothetical protein
MGSLSNLYISQSYTSLIHLGSDSSATTTPTELQDGLGNGLGVSVSTNGDLFVSGNVYATNLTGSSIDTGSFATTGSNTFFGQETFNGNLVINESGSAFGDALLITSGRLRVDTIGNYGSGLTINGSGAGAGDFNLNGYNTSIKLPLFDPISITGDTEITGALDLTGNLTASLEQGYVWVGNASGRTVTVATSSFGGGGTINTGSLVTTASFNAYTASQDFKNTTFATTGSNTFVGNQTINGNVNITGSLTASGLKYPSVDNGEKSFIQTDGNGNLSLQYVDTIFESFYAGESVPKGTPLYFSGSVGANPIARAADASNPNKMPVVLIANENLTATNTYEGIVLGLIEGIDLTGFTAGQTVYVAEGGGYSTSLPSGSNSITQVLGVITKGGSGGKGLVLNPGPAQLPGLIEGYAWVGNNLNQPVAVATSSFSGGTIDTASFATTGSNTFVGDQYISNGVLQVATYPQTSKTWFSPTAIEAVGTASVAYEQFVDGGGYDAFNVITNINAGTEFRDLPSDTFVLNTWLEIPQNTGNNPAPQFKRGLGITGSLSVTGSTSFSELTGSLGAFSASISNRINNISGSGGTGSVVGVLTTGSVGTYQTVLGGLNADFRYTASVVAGDSGSGGSNILALSYDIFNNPTFGYWIDRNFPSVLVNGPGVTNASVSSFNFGSNLELTLSSGTVTAGGNYTFTGPYFLDLKVTGSVHSNFKVQVTPDNNNFYAIDTNGFTAFDYTNNVGGQFQPGRMEVTQFNGNNFGMMSTASISPAGLDVTYQGPFLYTAYNGSNRPMIGFQSQDQWSDGRITVLRPLVSSEPVIISNDVTASKILVTDSGTTAIQYNQQSTGSVAGQFATSYGKDNIKVYQYQGQPYAFNVNLTANQLNAYTGSEFQWGLQLNGNNVSIPGGGGTYFSMASGSTTGSGEVGQDKLGLNYLGTSMILDMYADTSFRRKVYVDKGMYISQSVGGGSTPLIVNGTSAGSTKAVEITGSVNITGSLTVNGTSIGTTNNYAYITSSYQTGSNSGLVQTIRDLAVSTEVGFNITGSNNTGIKFENAGVYKIEYILQVQGGGTTTAETWFNKNSSPITNTISLETMASNQIIPITNTYIGNFSVNDVLEIQWASFPSSASLYLNDSGLGPEAVPFRVFITQIS